METIEDLDADVLLWLDDMDAFVCADRAHARGESYHTADAPAEFLMMNPCCGDRALICRSRAHYLKYVSATIHCMKCDRRWPHGAYRFIPLPGVLPL